MSPGHKKNISNQIRIIGGEHRGRKLTFPDSQGLRPTPDRVRETLFNWLQAYVPGAVCLDWFAGTGVLGFEALSRGADKVIFVERELKVFQSLKSNLDLLKLGDKTELNHMDALSFIEGISSDFIDIVFLDPPYGKGLVSECLKKLYDCQCLKSKGLVYLEQESQLGDPVLPENWIILKNKQAGQVNYYLLQAN